MSYFYALNKMLYLFELSHLNYVLLLFVIFLSYMACEQKEPKNEASDTTTCEGCHLNKSALQQFASEVPPVSETEGGG